MLSFKVFQNLSLASSWLCLKWSPVLFIFCVLTVECEEVWLDYDFWFFCELFWDYFIEGGVFIHQKAYNVFMSCSFTHFLTKIRLCVYCFLTHFSCWTIYFVHLSVPIYSSFFCTFFFCVFTIIYLTSSLFELFSTFSYKEIHSELPGRLILLFP